MQLTVFMPKTPHVITLMGSGTQTSKQQKQLHKGLAGVWCCLNQPFVPQKTSTTQSKNNSLSLCGNFEPRKLLLASQTFYL